MTPWEMPVPQTMSETACAIHEFYTSLREQGFTRHEAFHIMMNQPMCCDEIKGE